jgi:hypothetical protein
VIMMITAAASRNTTVGVTYFSHGRGGLGCGSACSACADGVGAGVVAGVGVEAAAMFYLLEKVMLFGLRSNSSVPTCFSSALICWLRVGWLIFRLPAAR